MPKISIVVPVYRVQEAFFRAGIDSILKQSERDLELLIVSDGAAEETLTLCREYERKDPRVRLLTQENQGVAVARNLGLSQAKAPYITFVDADDWVEPEFVSAFLQEFRKDPNLQIVSVASFLNKGETERENPFWEGDKKLFTGKEKEQLQLQAIYKGAAEYVPPFATFGATWAKAYDTKWLKENGITYDPFLRRGQDTLFNLNAFEKAEKILYVEKYLYHYRTNDGSAVNKYTENVMEILERISDRILEFIKEQDKDQRFYDAYRSKSVQLLTQAINCDYAHRDNPQGYWKRRGQLLKLLRTSKYHSVLQGMDTEGVPFSRRVLWFLLRHRMVDLIFLAHALVS